MRILILALVLLLASGVALAHPGKTDSVGGHKCLKGCEKWALLYGEYHLHDKDGKAIRVAKKGRARHSAAVENEEVKDQPYPVAQPAGVAPIVQSGPPVQSEEPGLAVSPLLLIVLALLLLLLLRRSRKHDIKPQ